MVTQFNEKKLSSTKQLDCVIIGNILFDYFVFNDEVENQHRGGIKYEDKKMIAKKHTEHISPGGTGNVAVGMSKLGLKTAFIGKIGNDALGKKYRDDLVNNNVVPKLFFDDKLETGTVEVLIDKTGERSFNTYLGAKNLTPEEIVQSSEIISNSEYLFVSGYSLNSHPEAILKAIEIAKENAVKIIFDPGSHNIIYDSIESFRYILKNSSIFCPNESEVVSITESKSLDEAINKMKKSKNLIALKLGDKGCKIIKNNQINHDLGIKVNQVDTTGAGDAFISALVYGIERELSLPDTAKFANWFASFIVTKIGARNYPSQKEINEFIYRIEK